MSLEPAQLRKEVGKATFILENVEIGLEISNGAYGVVNEVKIDDGTLCAGKMPHEYLVREDKTFLKKFCNEVLLHVKQHHPNIVQVIGLHYPPSSRFIPMLIMEYLPMTLGNCLDKKQPMLEPEELKRPQTQYSILLGVANGLIYLHQKEPPVYHRDLTAYNVLLTANFTAKISDLGMSRIVSVSGERLTAAPGNVNVMPPEAKKDNPVYNHKIDVFAFGCLILHIASGQFPVPKRDSFQENPNDDTCTSYIKITEWSRRHKYVEAILDEDDHELLPLAQQCLEDNPRDRPEMIDLVHFIENTKTIGLIDSNLDSIIKNAPEVTICGKRVPNCRSCPTCSYIIEHDPDGSERSSKFVVCPRCKKEYCFLCLQARDACLKDAPESWYGDCARIIAPRQTGRNN